MPRALLCLTTFAVTAAAPAVFAQEGMDNELKEMTWLGFQQFKEVSRVFVRTTEPVKYRVDSSRENMVVLILENTVVPLKNNRRFLDTRFFDSPVTYIQPKVIEGPSQSVRIEITLRRRVPFKEVPTDNVLALEFER
jgi:colicin import membrane protein